jgi:hypothetical protein
LLTKPFSYGIGSLYRRSALAQELLGSQKCRFASKGLLIQGRWTLELVHKCRDDGFLVPKGYRHLPRLRHHGRLHVELLTQVGTLGFWKLTHEPRNVRGQTRLEDRLADRRERHLGRKFGWAIVRERKGLGDQVEIGLIVRIWDKTTGITSFRHELGEIWESSEHALVVVTVSVCALGDMFEAVIVELSQEGAITLVAKVLLTDHSFEEYWDFYSKCSSMGHPLDALLELFPRQDVVDLLREAHGGNILVIIVSKIGGNCREVVVGMVHVFTGSLDDLNHAGILGADKLDSAASLLLGAPLGGFLRFALDLVILPVGIHDGFLLNRHRL